MRKLRPARDRTKIWTLIFLAPKVLPLPPHYTHQVPSVLDLSPAWSSLRYQDRSGHSWSVTVTPIIATSKEQEIVIQEPSVPRQLAPAHKGRQHYYFKNPLGHKLAAFGLRRLVQGWWYHPHYRRPSGKTQQGPSLVWDSLEQTGLTI